MVDTRNIVTSPELEANDIFRELVATKKLSGLIRRLLTEYLATSNGDGKESQIVAKARIKMEKEAIMQKLAVIKNKEKEMEEKEKKQRNTAKSLKDVTTTEYKKFSEMEKGR